MSELSRRGFLKACGVVGVASALTIPVFRLIEPQIQLIKGERFIAGVRELMQYAINNDACLLRYDILGPDKQFHVTAVAPRELYDDRATPAEIEKALRLVREPVAHLMRDRMVHEGWTVADLRPLPIPRGIYPGFPKSIKYLGSIAN